MHTKMVRYEKVVSVSSFLMKHRDIKLMNQELNTKRLRKEPFELCEAFEESANGDVSCSLCGWGVYAHVMVETRLTTCRISSSRTSRP